MNAIKHLGGIFDFDVKKSRLDQISKELEDPSIWNDQSKSQALGKEKRELDFIINGLTD
jgi:peptide chain release factor 2